MPLPLVKVANKAALMARIVVLQLLFFVTNIKVNSAKVMLGKAVSDAVIQNMPVHACKLNIKKLAVSTAGR